MLHGGLIFGFAHRNPIGVFDLMWCCTDQLAFDMFYTRNSTQIM